MALYQWGVWYKSIFEMSPTDKPEDRIVDDDEELDKWFDRYMKDIARKAAQAKGGRGSINGDADRERARRINVFGPNPQEG